jgi:hypothetical protein
MLSVIITGGGRTIRAFGLPNTCLRGGPERWPEAERVALSPIRSVDSL